MSRKLFYIVMVSLFLCITLFVIVRYNKSLKNQFNAFYPLKERKGANATAEWVSQKNRAANLIKSVRENPEDIKSALALATLYIQEARITGNTTYYDAAALHYINRVLEQNPNDFEALTLKALVFLSQHHFAEAITIAAQAQKQGPYNAFVYGLLVDGYVEMGNYTTAVANAEKMMALRPDIRSYSRVAYLREIHGDINGAIEAMTSAVKAGGVGDEPSSWARVQLARLYEMTGDLKRAEMHYIITLDERPGYAYALAGLGNIAWANKEYDKAIQYYEQADSLFLDYSFKERLASIYEEKGDAKKANALMRFVLKGLSEHVGKSDQAQNIGHNVDHELANAYVRLKQYDRALTHALADYNRRPENIDVNEAVAWVYFKKNAFKKALPYINEALRTNCKNPALLTKAGLIYAANGMVENARNVLVAALQNDPLFEKEVKDEGMRKLASL